MSYDHVLLPSGAATTLDEADAYLAAQQGLPQTPTVAAIAAELNARNDELPTAEGILANAPVGDSETGAALQVSSSHEAIGRLRALLFEFATPRDYAVYDPQLAWLIDPAGHLPVAVTHGGAGEFPYLTARLAHEWVANLPDHSPYLIVERAPQYYIQTFRDNDGTYILEYRDGSPDRHVGTRLAEADRVAELLWAWTTGDRTRLDTIDWQPVDL